MNKTTHQVEMEATRENMIRMLETTKEYLETLSDEELFKLGIEQGLWK